MNPDPGENYQLELPYKPSSVSVYWKKITVPKGLPALLETFVREAIRENPDDIYGFLADLTETILAKRDKEQEAQESGQGDTPVADEKTPLPLEGLPPTEQETQTKDEEAEIVLGEEAKEEEDLSAQFVGDDEEQAAATKLQASFRGFQTRKTLRQQQNDNENEPESETPAVEEPIVEKIKAVSELQSEQNEEPEQLPPSNAEDIVTGEEDSSNAAPPEEINGEEDLSAQFTGDDDEQAAATKLQASFRGYQTRKALREPKENDETENQDEMENQESNAENQDNDQAESLGPEDPVVDEVSSKTVIVETLNEPEKSVSPTEETASLPATTSTDSTEIEVNDEEIAAEIKTPLETIREESFDQSSASQVLPKPEVAEVQMEEKASEENEEEKVSTEEIETAATDINPDEQDISTYVNEGDSGYGHFWSKPGSSSSEKLHNVHVISDDDVDAALGHLLEDSEEEDGSGEEEGEGESDGEEEEEEEEESTPDGELEEEDGVDEEIEEGVIPLSDLKDVVNENQMDEGQTIEGENVDNVTETVEVANGEVETEEQAIACADINEENGENVAVNTPIGEENANNEEDKVEIKNEVSDNIEAIENEDGNNLEATEAPVNNSPSPAPPPDEPNEAIETIQGEGEEDVKSESVQLQESNVSADSSGERADTDIATPTEFSVQDEKDSVEVDTGSDQDQAAPESGENEVNVPESELAEKENDEEKAPSSEITESSTAQDEILQVDIKPNVEAESLEPEEEEKGEAEVVEVPPTEPDENNAASSETPNEIEEVSKVDVVEDADSKPEPSSIPDGDNQESLEPGLIQSPEPPFPILKPESESVSEETVEKNESDIAPNNEMDSEAEKAESTSLESPKAEDQNAELETVPQDEENKTVTDSPQSDESPVVAAESHNLDNGAEDETKTQPTEENANEDCIDGESTTEADTVIQNEEETVPEVQEQTEETLEAEPTAKAQSIPIPQSEDPTDENNETDITKGNDGETVLTIESKPPSPPSSPNLEQVPPTNNESTSELCEGGQTDEATNSQEDAVTPKNEGDTDGAAVVVNNPNPAPETPSSPTKSPESSNTDVTAEPQAQKTDSTAKEGQDSSEIVDEKTPLKPEKPEVKPRLNKQSKSCAVEPEVGESSSDCTNSTGVIRRPKSAAGGRRSRITSSSYRSGVVMDNHMSLEEMEKVIENEMLDKAALKIQSQYRGFKTRKELGVSRNGGKLVRSCSDGDIDVASACVNVLSEESIAENLQNANAQDEIDDKNSDEVGSLPISDLEQNPEPAEEDIDLDLTDPELAEAALKIQSQFRGFKMRKNLKQIEKTQAAPEPTEDIDLDLTDPELAEAALKIQSQFRCFKMRKNLNKSVIEETQSVQEPGEENVDLDLTDPQLAEAALKIQSQFRGFQMRNLRKPVTDEKGMESTLEPKEDVDLDLTDPQLAEAALKIQSQFRGFQMRKNFKKPGVEETQQPAEDIDLDLTDPDLAEAALKIQSQFRGFKLRKTLNKKPSVEQTQEPATEDVDLDLADPQLAEAALKIQSQFRNFRQRKALKQPSIEENKDVEDIDLESPALIKAATKIQANFRGFQVRKALRRPSIGENITEEDLESMPALIKAAVKIQSNFRGFQVRKAFRKLSVAANIKDEILDDAESMPALIDAAVLIQSNFRGFLVRKALKGPAVEEIEKNETPDNEVMQFLENGFDETEYDKESEDAAAMIQSRFRSYKERRKYYQAKKAAIVIQAALRGYLARKRVYEMLDAIKEQNELHKAAVRIQAIYRGFQVRSRISRRNNDQSEVEDE